MSIARKLLFSFSNLFPFDLLLKRSGVNPLLPYHHVVSDEELPHIRSLYHYKNRKDFIKDLDLILFHFKPLHPDQLKGTVPPGSFLFSFDDGYREIYEEVAPILIQKGIPALFFINSAFTDNKELFYRCKLSLVLEKIKKSADPSLLKRITDFLEVKEMRLSQISKSILSIYYPEKDKADGLGRIAEIDFNEYLKTHSPFLTSAQLQSLVKQGFVLGGHSIDHPDYKYISLEEQLDQTLTSTRFLDQFQTRDFQFFAFPHNDRSVSRSFFEEIEKKSSKPFVFFGVQNQVRDCRTNLLHRFNAEDPASTIKMKVKTVLLYNTMRNLSFKKPYQRD